MTPQSNVVREINEIDRKYFKEQTKPAIDLVGNYGINGLAGSINYATALFERETIERMAALASSVVASTPAVLPLIKS